MIKSIFAADAAGGLGKDGTLPWPRDPEDLNWFRTNTTGHIVVMGKNTWMDPMMPKPLPNRINAVVTSRDPRACDAAHLVIPGDHLAQSLGKLQSDHPHKTIWIIGGAQLLSGTMDLAEEIYLTRFDGSYGCDVTIDMDHYLRNHALVKEIQGKNKRFQIYEKLPRATE